MANGLTNGELIKLRIFAYDKPERIVPKDMFDVMYNPNSYAVNYKVNYNERQGQGEAGTEQKFERVPAKEYNFELLLDGTGASDPGVFQALAQSVPVLGDVVQVVSVKLLFDRFLKVCYVVDPEKHRPKYLKLLWGAGFVLDCVLMSADITYTLFNPDGLPVRAKVKAVFKESQQPGFFQQLLKLRSPDLTTIRDVQEGDNLPLLSEKEYDDPSHYIELARVNRLKNFRRLRVGDQLSFPPLRPSPEL